MKKLLLFLSVFGIFCFSCSPYYRATNAATKDYRITSGLVQDSNLLRLIKPYSDSVNNSMSTVVGVASMELEKKLPESTLGNFFADAELFMAKEKFGIPVDAALINYGGLRLSQLPAGPVTRGKIFEIMPFDNVLVVQQLKGTVLQQLLDIVAAKGGWPVSGISMKIYNNKAVDIYINGKPLNKSQTYTVAYSDFIANGGDDAFMLKNIPQKNIGYLLRDAFIDYITLLTKNDKTISATIEYRILN